jgi:hypothetical protein
VRQERNAFRALKEADTSLVERVMNKSCGKELMDKSSWILMIVEQQRIIDINA